ncbi:siderophore-interacting protein [Egicoccus sp. AB-alg6-2]|uniref:siderophore-interacting protein n=1 Tax=Egicoccus sp. AB-alg6-2 TaxID=3242692 RepID=UPI00359DDA9E
MTVAPFVLAAVRVTAVSSPSPSYVRVEFGGPELADIGVDGPWYDQRIKIVFPPASGVLPDLAPAGADWYAVWLALPESERGALRTYSVRDVHGTGTKTRLVVDFVLHLAPGSTGPASTWASTAAVGDQVLLLAPRRGHPFGGIEFAPGDATRLLFAADETGVPALSRILEDLPGETTGAAFCEVPRDDDVLEVRRPSGIDLHWLPRNGTDVGHELIPAVLAHLGHRATAKPGQIVDEDAHETVWETPTYSAAGDDLTPTTGGIPGLYAWIAGECHLVAQLRRQLVRDLGMGRNQVAFMGYWRKSLAVGE